MTVRAHLRGVEHVPARYAPDTRHDLNSFPLPAGSILEPGEVLQTFKDVLALIFIVLFLCACALSFPVAIFVLLVVGVG